MGRRKGELSEAERQARHKRTTIQVEGDDEESEKKRERIRRSLEFSKRFFDLPPVNPDNFEEVDARINLYVDSCLTEGFIPTMAGLALATGVDRRTLAKWAEGARRGGQAHGQAIKRFKEISTSVIINGMLSGEVQAIPGIFVTSNDGDYEQKATHTVQVEPGVTSGMSQEQLAKRYSPDVIDTTAEPHQERAEVPQKAESLQHDSLSIPAQKEPQKG